MNKQQRLDELRRKAEEQLHEVMPGLDEKSVQDVQSLLHDLHVHQIELSLQNEELIRTQAELQASQKKYVDLYEKYLNLYDFAPVGYCTLAKDGTIQELNLTAAEQLGQERDGTTNSSSRIELWAAPPDEFPSWEGQGVGKKSLCKHEASEPTPNPSQEGKTPPGPPQGGNSHSQLIGTRIQQYIVEEDQDRFFLYLRNAFDSHTRQTCEIRLLKQDGTAFHAQLKSLVVQNDSQDADAPIAPCCRTTIADITDIIELEEQLEARLHEREVLLKEVYHRVKNNFNAMHSMLCLQADNAQEQETRTALQTIMNRMKSMAAIHQRLYESDNLAEIDFGDVAYSLTADLFHAYDVRTYRVALRVDADAVILRTLQAFPCAMLLNELVCNALKYAFPDERSGELRIELHEQEGEVTLVVSDNGVGLPPDMDIQHSSSLGLQLVHSFVHRLGGTIHIQLSPGATFTVTFPKK